MRIMKKSIKIMLLIALIIFIVCLLVFAYIMNFKDISITHLSSNEVYYYDLDNNGEKEKINWDGEIVFVNDSIVKDYTRHYFELGGNKIPVSIEELSNVGVCDINNDGTIEVVLGLFNGMMDVPQPTEIYTYKNNQLSLLVTVEGYIGSYNKISKSLLTSWGLMQGGSAYRLYKFDY